MERPHFQIFRGGDKPTLLVRITARYLYVAVTPCFRSRGAEPRVSALLFETPTLYERQFNYSFSRDQSPIVTPRVSRLRNRAGSCYLFYLKQISRAILSSEVEYLEREVRIIALDDPFVNKQISFKF